MRVLVAYGSQMGGTEGIAQLLAEELRGPRMGADALPAGRVADVLRYDAVIVGGALYAGRWHGDARRFVARHRDVLARLPVWLFSSGPLDGSAATGHLDPVPEVAVLAQRVRARGHATFGGRLPVDLAAVPGSAVAEAGLRGDTGEPGRGAPGDRRGQVGAGDWRDPPRIRAWASEIAGELRAEAVRPAHHQSGSPRR